MEIGSLICKPKNPHCEKCPITKNCLSFKNKDFVIQKKNKKIINKFYLVTLYKNHDQVLLIKNDRFKFLKNLLIFPMREINQKKFKSSLSKRINIKMSNMDMKITINKKNRKKYLSNSFFLEKDDIKNHILPSFTKKIFKSVIRY